MIVSAIASACARTTRATLRNAVARSRNDTSRQRVFASCAAVTAAATSSGSVRRTEPTGSSVAGLTETSSVENARAILGIVRLPAGGGGGRGAVEVLEQAGDPGGEILLAHMRLDRLGAPAPLVE